MERTVHIWGTEVTYNPVARCGKRLDKPRCGKHMPENTTGRPAPDGHCGLPENHKGYCVRGGTGAVPAAWEPKYCALRFDHSGHCSSYQSVAQKREAKASKYVPRERDRRKDPDRRDPGNVFSRGDLDRLKVWIGCQNEDGCPVGLGGKGDTATRRPEWYDWDHIDPATKIRMEGQSGTRLAGRGNRLSFAYVTEIFQVELLRVLCKCCHATRTKIQQAKNGAYQQAREKPDTVHEEINWNEHPAYRNRTQTAETVREIPQRPGIRAENFGDRFPRGR